jgi:hypothetical protein
MALGQHRALLIGRARAEREHLGVLVARADSALSWVEVLRKGADEVRRHPLLVAAALALLAVLRPRGAVKLLASGWSLWRLYQRVRRLWALANALAASTAAQKS